MKEIIGYQPLVDEIKDLINKKQYQVLKLMNAETIKPVLEIGEEIYRQQQEKAGENLLYRFFQMSCRKNFLVQRDIRLQIFGECEIFILHIVTL